MQPRRSTFACCSTAASKSSSKLSKVIARTRWASRSAARAPSCQRWQSRSTSTKVSAPRGPGWRLASWVPFEELGEPKTAANLLTEYLLTESRVLVTVVDPPSASPPRHLLRPSGRPEDRSRGPASLPVMGRKPLLLRDGGRATRKSPGGHREASGDDTPAEAVRPSGIPDSVSRYSVSTFSAT